MSTTDLRFLSRLSARHDQPTWFEFVQRYGAWLARVARRAGVRSCEIEDLVQETLLAVRAGLAGRRDERGRGRFRAWLKGIVRNKVLEHRRRAARRARRERAAAFARGTCSEPELDAIISDEYQRARLRRALDVASAGVSPATLQAFQLFTLEEMPARRVAQLLGISRNAVFLAKHNMLCRLRRAARAIDLEEDHR